MKKLTRTKKIFTIVFISFFVLGTAYTPVSPTTPEANAQFEEAFTGCAASAVGGGLAASIGNGARFLGGFTVPVVDPAKIGIDSVKSYVFDCLSFAASQFITKQLTDGVLEWVNGADGSGSKFVRNYSGYFSNEINNASLVFIDEIAEDTNLPEEMKARLRLAFIQERANSDVSEQLEYTFPPEYTGFVEDNDFSQGGWAAYESFLQNNDFENYLVAKRILSERQNAARQQARDVYTTNNGFVNIRECISFTFSGACAQYSIDTPGALIEEQVNNVLGSPIDKLEMADELNEVLALYFTETFNSVFAGGGTLAEGPSEAPSEFGVGVGDLSEIGSNNPNNPAAGNPGGGGGGNPGDFGAGNPSPNGSDSSDGAGNPDPNGSDDSDGAGNPDPGDGNAGGGNTGPGDGLPPSPPPVP